MMMAENHHSSTVKVKINCILRNYLQQVFKYAWHIHYNNSVLLECDVKGPMWLDTVPKFDLAKGVVVDYMHVV